MDTIAPMRTIVYFKILLLLVSLCTMLSCNKSNLCKDPSNPECENFDPCYGKKSINTHFRVRPGDRGFNPPEAWCNLKSCDTFNSSSVRFDIPEGNLQSSSYEWQIGDEQETRKGSSFEIDFSDYLQDSGWEVWIPVSLTIKSPLSDCLLDPNDTLITVSRDLYFTKYRPAVFDSGKSIARHKGYILSDPEKEVIIQHLIIREGSFRGIDAPVAVVVGLPGIDTFAYNPPCSQNYCTNHIQSIVKIDDPAHCYPEATNYLRHSEFLFFRSSDRLKRVWIFDTPKGVERYIFIGQRVI